MAKPGFLRRDQILWISSIYDQVSLFAARHNCKIGTLLLLKFYFRLHNQYDKIVRDLRVQISVQAATKSQIEYTVTSSSSSSSRVFSKWGWLFFLEAGRHVVMLLYDTFANVISAASIPCQESLASDLLYSKICIPCIGNIEKMGW